MNFTHEAADVALEGGAAAPAEHGAADGAPGGDDDVDAAVDVWVLCGDGGGVCAGQVERRVLPDTQGLVERVEAVAGVALGAEREGGLAAVAGRGVQGQGVGDVGVGLERADDVDDQVQRLGLVAVRQDHVDVAAQCLAAPVPAHDHALDVRRRAVLVLADPQHPPRVLHHHVADPLHLGPRDLDLELVVVLDPDLLHPRQRVPPELDHVVQVPPPVLKVEFARRVGAHAPDVPEQVEDL